MSKEVIQCLYCQTENTLDSASKQDDDVGNCQHCGMPLTRHAPESSRMRTRRFLPFFWLIVIFCLVMVIYLPR